MAEVKESKISFLLKNDGYYDPVDRIRGHEVINALKNKGVNVDYFNENYDADILYCLGNDLKTYVTIKRYNPKGYILDVQDDILTKNKTSMKHVPGANKGKIQRWVGLFKKQGVIVGITLAMYRLISNRLARHLIRNADYVVTSSKSLEKITSAITTRIVTIPDGVNDSHFTSEQSIIDRNKDCSVSIAWIGTPANIKYLQLINDVLKKVVSNKNVSFKLITSKQIYSEKSFVDVLNKLEFSFTFVEWREDTIQTELSKCHIGVAPLPLGIAKSTNKILSYMQSGLAVVCSGSSDYYSLYQEYPNAFIYEDNHEQWGDLIEKLVKDPSYRVQLAIDGFKIAHDFSTSALVDKYESVFHLALNTCGCADGDKL